MAFELADLFRDHMVVQRGMNVRIWGEAPPGRIVRVSLADQTATASAGSDGKWMTSLPPMEAGGPHELIVTCDNEQSIRLSDVLVGDVWLASGQSNMEWPLAWSDNAEQEIAQANWPQIRLFTVPLGAASSPAANTGSDGWHPVTPESIKDFSAVAYYFGRDLHQELDVPIGLIDTAFGGAMMEAYTPLEDLKSSDTFAWTSDHFEKWRREHDDPNALANYEKAREQWLAQTGGDLFHDDPGRQPETRGWENLTFDDSDWKTMQLPGIMEAQGLENVDGVVWFRRTVEVPEGWAGRDLLVSLGPVDDFDTTWFNGFQIGGMGPDQANAWSTPRLYLIPASVVKPGRNVIAVRVFDHYLSGGFTGAPEAMMLSLADVPSQPMSMSGEWKYKVALPLMQEPSRPGGVADQHVPSGLFNAMIAPVIPFTIKGAIWYQGESNAERAGAYLELTKLMIGSWRREWNQGDFPFLMVQLSSFAPGADWPPLRQAQMDSLSIPNTALVMSYDVGHPTDIHPKDKKTVGGRLARAALAKAYGQDVVYEGPRYQSFERDGEKLKVHFDISSGPLSTQGGQNVLGLELAGADGAWHPAEGRVLNDDTLLVWSGQVREPQRARYAWQAYTEANLINRQNLPAYPFQTE